MPKRRLQSLTHGQRERLAFIDFRLCFIGEIGRPDLLARFGVASAAATRDFALYRELVPDNTVFDGSNKVYRISPDFEPLFEHQAQQVLALLSAGVEDCVQVSSAPLLPCESPSILTCPSLQVLALLCRAIYGKRPLAITYHSLSSGEGERIIVPIALVNTGLRWHVRAYCRKHAAFRDFVLARIVAIQELDEQIDEGVESSAHDKAWCREICLELLPHPKAPHGRAIELDYGLAPGQALQITVRAATAAYFLRRWGVDCSEDSSLNPAEYQLILREPKRVAQLADLAMAPGFTQEMVCK